MLSAVLQTKIVGKLYLGICTTVQNPDAANWNGQQVWRKNILNCGPIMREWKAF